MLDNGQLSNKIHINDQLSKYVTNSSTEDKFNFGVAKFILAAQKEIAKEVVKSKIELIFLVF